MEDAMKWRDICAGGLLFLLPWATGATAAETSGLAADNNRGLYIAFDFSGGAPNDPVADGVYEADLGFETGLRLGMGYAFAGVRLEGQIGYENFYLNNVNPLPGSPLSEADTTGDLSGPVMMANLLYDFGAPGGTRPFVGTGVGFANLKADYHGFYCSIFTLQCWDGEQVVSGSDTVMAWQAMAGISTPTSSGNGEWYVGYRYFGSSDIELNVIGYGPVTQEGVQAHSLMLGWRWQLPSY
jgi:opacity protein-like surface antigen